MSLPVICALGDLLLDVIVRLRDPLALDDDTVAETRTGPGGQAANAAAWSAAVGAEARFVGKLGDDVAGPLLAKELEARGVRVLGPPPAGRSGVVVSLVDAEGGRSMASDRGSCPELAPEELDACWFEGCDWLHVAGYSLLREPIATASVEASRLARDRGARVSVDLSTWNGIRDAGPEHFLGLLRSVGPDVVFATERELDALGAAPPAPAWVVKRGSEGIAVTRGAGMLELPALPAQVVDSTGAGDALAAGYLVGGAELGLEAAARCVASVGAMP
ncbi:MAG: carbohydrate kinase family protein [Gaiellaceae bacterium]